MKKPHFSLIFLRSLKLGVNNVWRNKMLSLATIFVTGTILFIFNIILAVNFIAQDSLNNLSKKIDITVYLKETTTIEQSQKIIQELSGIEGIEKVDFTSKEEALKQIKTTHPGIALAFEKYSLENPLPASLNIITIDPKYHVDIAKVLNSPRYQPFFSNFSSTQNEDSILSGVSKNLVELNNFTHQVIFWLIIIFILGGTLVILNALQITIFHRKKEINVMKLVGASHWFIKSPYIIESIIYGISAVLISLFLLIIISQQIEIHTNDLWSYYSGNILFIFLAELLITIGLSIFSSLIAVHEYIKQDLLED